MFLGFPEKKPAAASSSYFNNNNNNNNTTTNNNTDNDNNWIVIKRRELQHPSVIGPLEFTSIFIGFLEEVSPSRLIL